ncbi:LETM1-like protein [Nitzschia inconspicua]|uniref:LETM1-like protein n=1 Tax=Nitzschia inconspicua TaxID=303405 RepID=A0A9K3PYQ9_9STRA|nr:LETM1-like protein [Nitzschia inconspicua]
MRQTRFLRLVVAAVGSSFIVVVVHGSTLHIPLTTSKSRWSAAAASASSSSSPKTSATTILVSDTVTTNPNDSVAPSALTVMADESEGESAQKSTDSGGNPLAQLIGYAKDSFVRTIDGTKEMWTNHGRCKEIRAKQQDYREKLKKRWEFEEKDLTPKEMKERLAKVNGGITYDEFVFLIKGKEDRGKLMNLGFLMWGAPRFFPYALMFYPEILPSPFAPLPDTSTKETKLQKLSRERSHAVLRTLIAIENEAKAVPALAKLNFFGKKGQARRMDEMDSLGKTIGQIMTTSGIESGADGAKVVMNTMENLLYKKGEDFTRAEKRLVTVPKSIATGIMNAVSGPNLFQTVMPHFLRRGQVLNHLQKLAEIDNFLVNENIDLNGLSTARLLEACSDRMIGGPGRTDEELRQDLNVWLELAVNQPTQRIGQSGEYFNENLARTALLSFYLVCGAGDSRSTSYLPRLMYQGRQEDDMAAAEGRKKSRKR